MTVAALLVITVDEWRWLLLVSGSGSSYARTRRTVTFVRRLYHMLVSIRLWKGFAVVLGAGWGQLFGRTRSGR